MNTRLLNFSQLLFLIVALFTAAACNPTKKAQVEKMEAYLMVYFTDPTHSLFMALSTDGYTFTDVNNAQPIVAGDTIASQKGMTRPKIGLH